MASVTQACAPVVEVINSSCAARIFLCYPDGGVFVNTYQVTQAAQLSCLHRLDPDPELEHTLLSDSENMCTHTSHTYTLAHITKKFQRQYFILLLMLLSPSTASANLACILITSLFSDHRVIEVRVFSSVVQAFSISSSSHIDPNLA